MMKSKKNEMGTKIAKLFVITAAVYLGMRFIVPIVLPFLLAFALARLLYPLAEMLEKKTGCQRNVARLLTYGIFLAGIGAVIAGLLYLCYRMGSSCLDHMDGFKENAQDIFCTCCDRVEQMLGIRAGEIQKTIDREDEGVHHIPEKSRGQRQRGVPGAASGRQDAAYPGQCEAGRRRRGAVLSTVPGGLYRPKAARRTEMGGEGPGDPISGKAV